MVVAIAPKGEPSAWPSPKGDPSGCVRLESVYVCKGIEGSTPSLSAMYRGKIIDFDLVHGDAIIPLHICVIV